MRLSYSIFKGTEAKAWSISGLTRRRLGWSKCQSPILNLATALDHTYIFLLMSEDWRKEMIGRYF